MTSPDLSRFRDCEALPSPSAQVARVLDKAAHASAMDYNIVQIIQYDPAIAARVLKIANSPLYGYESQIGSLQQAAGLLGPGVIKSIILTTPILEIWDGLLVEYKSRIDYTRLWQHASATGAIAGGLGSAWNGFETDVCFTAGLLHDLGKIALAVFEPLEFVGACEAARAQNKPLVEMQKQRLGFTHLDVGRELAWAWKFPGQLVATLEEGSAPPVDAADHLGSLVTLAGNLADQWGFDDGTGIPETTDREVHLGVLRRTPQDLAENEAELKNFAELVTGKPAGK